MPNAFAQLFLDNEDIFLHKLNRTLFTKYRGPNQIQLHLDVLDVIFELIEAGISEIQIE